MSQNAPEPADRATRAAQRRDLTTGPVGANLRELAIPLVIGMVSVMVFNLVDTYFAGRLGTDELAAMGYTFPIVALIASANIGLGIGATAIIARCLGAGERERARTYTRDSLMLSLVIAIGASVLGVLLLEPTFRLLGADPARLALVRDYMSIWYLGLPIILTTQVGTSVLRAAGDTRAPAIAVVVASLINVALDPLLMFGVGPFPRMELRGAATATLIARLVSFLIVAWLLRRRERLLTLRRPVPREVLHTWRQILAVGGPAAGANAMSPLALAAVTGIVARYGPSAVGAYGAGSRISIILLLPALATASAMPAFIGQNLGAGVPERIRSAITSASRFVLASGLVLYGVIAATAPLVSRGFTQDPEVAVALTAFLRLGIAGLALEGAVMVASQTFNGYQRGGRAAVLTAIRLFVLVIPGVATGARLGGLRGAFIGLALANAAAGIIGLTWLRTLSRPPSRTVVDVTPEDATVSVAR